jgi:hypothetical protein
MQQHQPQQSDLSKAMKIANIVYKLFPKYESSQSYLKTTQKSKLFAVVERWFLLQNNQNLAAMADSELIRESKEGKLMENPEQFLTELKNIMNQPANVPEIVTVKVAIRGDIVTVLWSGTEIRKEIWIERWNRLTKLATPAQIYNMILRYQTFLLGNQQWNIPTQIYKWFIDNYAITAEGFGSPLNSQMLMLLDKPVFCSLFADTDKPFGSRGSFFEETFADHTSIMVNPPYVAEILEKSVDKCFEIAAQRPEMLIFYTCPSWKDAPWFGRLQKGATFHWLLPARGYFYQDTNIIPPSTIKAPFESSLFVIAGADAAKKFTDRGLVKYWKSLTDKL